MSLGDKLILIAGLTWAVWSAFWYLGMGSTKESKFSEGLAGRAQHVLPIFAGFILIFHGGQHPLVYGAIFENIWLRVAGVVMTVGGLLFATWARRHLGKYWSGMITLKEGHRLIRTGPYQYVRHPLYTGFLTAALGSALAARTGDALVGFMVLLIALLIKLRREEALLTREFGEEYVQFRREVPPLVPMPGRRGTTSV